MAAGRYLAASGIRLGLIPPRGHALRRVPVEVTVVNLGARIPNLVMSIDSEDTWHLSGPVAAVVDGCGQRQNVLPQWRSAPTETWSFGPLPPDATISISFHVDSAGDRLVFRREAYADVLADGTPDCNTRLRRASGTWAFDRGAS